MGLFGPSLPIDADEFEWLLATFAWLDRTVGEGDRRMGYVAKLVTPDDPALGAARTVPELFDAVRNHAGLEEWHCVVEAGDVREACEVGAAYLGEWQSQSALGTFSVEGNTPVIRYDPNLRRQPDALVATFAHELAHLLLASHPDSPGGHDLHEHATDCAAVYMGFGVFLANHARHFEQFQDAGMHGWSSRTSGYLSENALVTALALYVRLFGEPRDQAARSLKPYLRRPFGRALRYCDKHFPDLAAALARVDLNDWV
jgi:hypothetical protein